jgi:proteic killer suppression protein
MFNDQGTADLFVGINSKAARKACPSNLHASTRRKLVILIGAGDLADLRVPPSNRLEQLRGDRKGQYSIRINDQFRICFEWTEQGPSKIEIVDYH